MTKKIILAIIIIVSIIIIGYLQLSSKLQSISQEINYDYTDGDLSYSIVDLGEKEEYFKITVSDCVYFEANHYTGAYKKYDYKYIPEKENLKIILVGDNPEKHLEWYGVKGKICNLQTDQYNIIIGEKLYDDSIDEIFKKTVEIK